MKRSRIFVPLTLRLLIVIRFFPAAELAAAERTDESYLPETAFTLPDDLEITLWARTPMLRNPTNIDVDAQGRVWVAEGVNYRSHLNRQPEGDSIVVIEDTDGDGHADQSHTFVQEPGLIAPLGIAVIDNQIVVSCAPDLIVYTDVDRNGRYDPAIDKREILLTGFNGRNSDHSLHSVTVGPDGLWYFNHGNAGANFTDRSGKTYRIGSIQDPGHDVYGWKPADFSGAKSDDGHIYVGGFAARMHRDGTNVEIIGYNFRNSYEQAITSFGEVFQSDNDDPPACRTTYLMEYGNTGYFSRDGLTRWDADRRPGQSIPTAEWRQDDPGVIPAGDVYGGGAPTGAVLNEGDGLGKKWRGVLLIGEAARNSIFAYRPETSGAGYRLERSIFMTSNPSGVSVGNDDVGGHTSTDVNTYFRPSDVGIGPDGAVYIADWFDPRCGGHLDLDAGTSGAIYRIAPKGSHLKIPKIDFNTIAGQIEALKSPAINVRAIGFYRLKAAGNVALNAVSELLQDENPFVRARAVWLLAQLGPGGLRLVEQQLTSEDPKMRATAFQSLRRVGGSILQYAKKLIMDPSPGVRREVAVALRDISFPEAKELLLALARQYDGNDRAYLEAWGIGCTGKENDMYATLLNAFPDQRDPTMWSQAYANLVWRLTPPAAALDFSARAGCVKLTENERLNAVTALAFMPTREAAFSLLDLAEHAEGPVKQHADWWLLHYNKMRWSAFGLDAELKRRRLYNPETVTIVASVMPERPKNTIPPVTEITNLKGDPARGATRIQICYMCHRINDTGVEYGPNLTAFAKRQSKEAVITAIIDPSADISLGFEGTSLTLKDGTRIDGLLHNTGDPLIIRSMGNLQQLVPKERVATKKMMDQSLMLSASQLGLGAQDVADIVAYLRAQ